MKRSGNVTIYDIASEAGVSASTVSRVLNGTAKVDPQKIAAVEAVIAKYRYRPSAAAQQLSEKHSRVIGMVCPDVRNAYYANLFVECERAAFERGYTLTLNNSFGAEETEIAFMERLAQHAECILLCGGVIDWNPLPQKFRETLESTVRRVPVVVAGEVDMDGLIRIGIDQEAVMRLSVMHLNRLGHTKIAFLHGYGHIYQTQMKLKAYADTMRELGLPVRGEYLVNAGTFDDAAGAAGMQRILSLGDLPTAVIATNDLMAAGAMQTVLRLGFRVPDDFSIIGCDDSPIASLTHPNITGIRYDYAAYADQMIEAAVSAAEGVYTPPRRIMPALVMKDSCARRAPGRTGHGE